MLSYSSSFFLITQALVLVLLPCFLWETRVEAARPWATTGPLNMLPLQESNWTQQAADEGVVNLDLPPQQRWTEVCSKLANESDFLEAYLENSLHVNNAEAKVLEYLGETLFNRYGEETSLEIKGCADAMGISFGLLALLNVGYEARSLGGGIHNTTGPCDDCMQGKGASGNMCTSIIARQSDGKVIHGRNLDWNIPAELRNFVMTIHFTKGGEELFTSAVLLGYVGILTGLKPGKFSVSIDERGLGGNVFQNLEHALLNPKALQPSHLLRKAFEEAESYDEVLTMLSTYPLVAPVYYIIAGVTSNEGALLSRDYNESLHPLYLDNSTWYLLQTNYDHWVQPPVYDDRRSYGLEYMNKIPQANISLDQIKTVLGTWPVRNDDTSQTVLMNPLTSDWTFLIDIFTGKKE